MRLERDSEMKTCIDIERHKANEIGTDTRFGLSSIDPLVTFNLHYLANKAVIITKT